MRSQAWKYITVVCYICLVYCCIISGSVVSQNIFDEYFYRINCTVVDNVEIKTYNKLECAAKCLSDRLCEGFQAVKISHGLTKCLLFNVTSDIHTYQQDGTSFVKTHLLYKMNRNCHQTPSTAELTPITTSGVTTADANLISSTTKELTTKDLTPVKTTKFTPITTSGVTTADADLTSPTTKTLTTKALIPVTTIDVFTTTSTRTTTITGQSLPLITQCSVGAAIYISTSDEIWLFFHNYIQIYTSLNDLTTTHFNGEKMKDIFTDAPLDIDAGYFDGNNIFLIKDEEVFKYSSMSKGSTAISRVSTHSHFWKTVPSAIDAVIVNGNNDIFLFSNNQVTRLDGNTQNTFAFDNNGNQNYYKASNNNIRPNIVTAGTKTDTTTHYIFNGKTVMTFTEGGKKGTWNNVGNVICKS